MYILASFVKDEVSIGAWIYLWALHSVPLTYISLLVPAPHCLDVKRVCLTVTLGVKEHKQREFGLTTGCTAHCWSVFQRTQCESSGRLDLPPPRENKSCMRETRSHWSHFWTCLWIHHFGFPIVAQWRVRLQCRRHRFDPWVMKIPWKKSWQATPVFLPGKCHGRRSLVGSSPWGHQESYDWGS